MGTGTYSQFEHNIQITTGGSETLNLGSSADVIIPASDIASAYTINLLDGTSVGQRVHILCTGTAADAVPIVVLENTGIQIDGSTALVSLAFDAADEESFLEWNGLKWHLMDSVGATLASS